MAANDNNNWKLKWQKDFETFFPIYSSFVLEGYIDDDQPYIDGNGELAYCRLHEYFDKIYSENADPALKKRVIIYDPTESVDKRFTICDADCYAEPDEDSTEEEPKYHMTYNSSMSQHFWDIVHSEDLDKLLIDHRSSGVSLDLSKMHYAVTEDNAGQPGARLTALDEAQFSILREFREKIWDLLFGGNEPTGYLFVMRMTSRLLTHTGSSGLGGDELLMFRQLLNIAQSLENGTTRKTHKLVILANQVTDLPLWFTDEITNPFIKVINVSRPSEDNKLAFFDEMLQDRRCLGGEFKTRYDVAAADFAARNPNIRINNIQKKFLGCTNDFSMKMLRRYRNYIETHPVTDPDKLSYSVSAFRAGDMTNPWDNEKTISDMLNVKDSVSRKIQGQDDALTAAQQILARAALGVDRAENPNAPRVVLFLAGPTGTGKTELCKQLAQTVFGSEQRMIRFDMSEYREDESDQKLFGAPPGYIGYEEGGKLTNAVKKEPFSLILFDEIEKAANSILDKFLQIIGDGRLTDGKGETVSFTDCIIVITSNAGVLAFDDVAGGRSKEDVQKWIDGRMGGDKRPEGTMDISVVEQMENDNMSEKEIYARVREHLRYNVKTYFHCQLQRPELYGRIEDSIVYYNYIGKNHVLTIVNSKISDVIRTTVENNGLADIICPDDVRDKIKVYCTDGKVRALGARGIIKNTGKLFSTSLSDELTTYMRGLNGRSMDQLRGRTLVCYCDEDKIDEASDIKWRLQ